MNKLLNIAAVLDQPDLLENLVEKLATRHYDIGFSSQLVPENWCAVETSSTETYVSGTLQLASADNDLLINMPFITSMLFTCIKNNKTDYRLLWSSSLS